MNYTFHGLINMYLLKNVGIVNNAIFHILYRFFLILQMTCAVVLLLFPLSFANEHGATVLEVPVAFDDFPDGQEELETLLHHKIGLKEPRIYKYKAPKCFGSAMQLTPSWLKSHYGTLPLLSVREESTTQVYLSQYSLAQAIELIESDTCQNDVSFVSVLDQTIAHTLKICYQLSSLPFQGTRKSSINLLEHEPLLWPLNYEEKKVPITLPSNLSQIMFQRNAKDNKKIEKQLLCMHQNVQSTFDQAILTLPNHITFLEVSNKHHVEYLHQNMIHVSNVIVQIHGQQKVMLMPPVSEQHPYHHLLDSTGQFIFNHEINLSASDRILNNESRLAHTTLYSVYLDPGDLLLVPENWFIYRKSLDTSVSLSLNYLSSDTWRLFCFQSEPMELKKEHEYLAKKKCVVKEWMNIKIQQRPGNACNIIHAHENIQQAISDATQQVLSLNYFALGSLPDAIFPMPHIKTLNLEDNDLTSFSLNHITYLVSLNLAYNSFTSFSLSHVKNLVSLNFECNQLTFFSLSHMPNLASLNVAYNKLTSVSLDHMKNLIRVNLAYNYLTSFSLSHMKNLASLDFQSNQLLSFSLGHMEELAWLNLENNQLTSFSVHHMEKLASLYLGNNRLTSFSLNHMKNLTALHLSKNRLNTFTCYDLQKVTKINLRYNNLSHLDPNCISSINTDQFIILDLRNNPLSNETIIQIQSDLLKRPGNDATCYPIWFLFIKHIQHKAMEYKDFIHLLFCENIFSSSENKDFKCPITHLIPRQVIFFMTKDKHYILYDANALSQWIRAHPQMTTIDPSTREQITLQNIISANQPHVLKYLKQKLSTISTEIH